MVGSPMKRCSSCNRDLKSGDFYAGKSACKECIRARSAAHMREKRANESAESRALYNAKMAAYMHKKYHQDLEEGRRRNREYLRKWIRTPAGIAKRERDRQVHIRRRAERRAVRMSLRAALLPLRIARRKEQRRQYAIRTLARTRKQRRARMRAWRKANRERTRAYRRAREQRKWSTCDDPGPVKKFYRYVHTAPAIKCHYCGKDAPKGKRHVDHLIPLSRGGAHVLGNLVAACAACNLSKHTKTVDEFAVAA